MAAVLDAHRFALDHFVRLEIVQRERSTAFVHVLDDALARDRPYRELTRLPRAIRSNVVAELRDPEALALPIRTPVVAVHRVALGRMAQQPVEDLVQIPLRRRQLEAFARQRSRRRNELRPRHPPPPGMRLPRPERGAWHRDRRRTRPEELLRIAVEIDRQLQERARRRPPAAPSRRSRARPSSRRSLVHEHEPAAARARQRALAHPRRERSRDTSINSRAACSQYPCSRLGGQRMARPRLRHSWQESLARTWPTSSSVVRLTEEKAKNVNSTLAQIHARLGRRGIAAACLSLAALARRGRDAAAPRLRASTPPSAASAPPTRPGSGSPAIGFVDLRPRRRRLVALRDRALRRTPLRHRRGARYGVGSLVNTFVPFRAGDAVRIGLFSRALPTEKRLWTTGGAFAALGAARAVVLGALVVVGYASGAAADLAAAHRRRARRAAAVRRRDRLPQERRAPARRLPLARCPPARRRPPRRLARGLDRRPAHRRNRGRRRPRPATTRSPRRS